MHCVLECVPLALSLSLSLTHTQRAEHNRQMQSAPPECQFFFLTGCNNDVYPTIGFPDKKKYVRSPVVVSPVSGVCSAALPLLLWHNTKRNVWMLFSLARGIKLLSQKSLRNSLFFLIDLRFIGRAWREGKNWEGEAHQQSSSSEEEAAKMLVLVVDSCLLYRTAVGRFLAPPPPSPALKLLIPEAFLSLSWHKIWEEKEREREREGRGRVSPALFFSLPPPPLPPPPPNLKSKNQCRHQKSSSTATKCVVCFS